MSVFTVVYVVGECVAATDRKSMKQAGLRAQWGFSTNASASIFNEKIRHLPGDSRECAYVPPRNKLFADTDDSLSLSLSLPFAADVKTKTRKKISR